MFCLSFLKGNGGWPILKSGWKPLMYAEIPIYVFVDVHSALKKDDAPKFPRKHTV